MTGSQASFRPGIQSGGSKFRLFLLACALFNNRWKTSRSRRATKWLTIDEPAEESKHDDRSELQETAPPSFTAIPDDVEIGLFVLIMHEPAPTELELGEVIMIDELREHATVHTYGTYAKDKSGGFAPCYIDPKDEKAVYTSRPVRRYLASTRQVFHEHIHSVAFSLVKKGKAWRLPKDVQDVTWTVKA
jgi:hypothetical protein